METKTIAPTTATERLLSLDILRGFAVLGILVMNIQSFSMIAAAYFNPTAYGDFSGMHQWVWMLSHVLADQKFMTIFSIMFGAGIVLITQKMEGSGRGPAGLHYRRTFWLLIIGLGHAYLFWFGDILVTYALCGFVLYLFRNLSPRKLVTIGVCMVAVSSLLFLLLGMAIANGIEIEGSLLEDWQPSASAIAQEVAAYRGTIVEQFEMRAAQAYKAQIEAFPWWGFWRAGGLMLIGMALFKWGVLSAQLTRATYLRMVTVGFGIGLPIVIYGMFSMMNSDWSFEYARFFGWQFNYWGSILVSLGYIGLVMLFSLSNTMQWLKDALAAVGRMALTNYLLHSFLCTLLFYGHGFGLFGYVERTGQAIIVIAIWVLQLIVSPIWLRHFRFGPMEWLWRSLTYMKLQPMRIRQK